MPNKSVRLDPQVLEALGRMTNDKAKTPNQVLRAILGLNRSKGFLFTKHSYISVGYPPATDASSGYYKGAEVVNAIGCSVTLCLIPESEGLDSIKIYLAVSDAYELGQLLIDRAKVASQEPLERELGRR